MNQWHELHILVLFYTGQYSQHVYYNECKPPVRYCSGHNSRHDFAISRSLLTQAWIRRLRTPVLEMSRESTLNLAETCGARDTEAGVERVDEYATVVEDTRGWRNCVGISRRTGGGLVGLQSWL